MQRMLHKPSQHFMIQTKSRIIWPTMTHWFLKESFRPCQTRHSQECFQQLFSISLSQSTAIWIFVWLESRLRHEILNPKIKTFIVIHQRVWPSLLIEKSLTRRPVNVHQCHVYCSCFRTDLMVHPILSIWCHNTIPHCSEQECYCTPN